MAKKVIESKGYDNGYNDAIEAIKKMLQGDMSDGGEGGMIPDPKLNQPDINQNNSGNGKNKGQGSGSKSQPKSQNGSNSGSSGQGSSRGEGSQGIVSADDCKPIGNIGDAPNEPGGMIDSKTADDVAKAEGYEQISGADSSVEKEWSESSVKAASKYKGSLPGSFVSQIESIYKVSHDWKKELRKIVGNSISPDEKRQAYANKNVLISQDRIARTDKDKYDNMDYMMVFIDSSGSMTDEMLKRVLSEVYYVALAKKPIKLVIVQCDTQIQDVKVYTSLPQLKKDMIHASVKGRGGTELKPCWDMLRNDPKYKRRPAELVMVFTDGYLTQYKRDVRSMKNLCWVIIDNPSCSIEYKDINTKMVHLKSTDIK